MGAAPNAVQNPNDAAKSAVAAMVKEILDVEKAEVRAAANTGMLDDAPRLLPKLKNQHIFDDIDPLKGRGIRGAQFVKCLLIARMHGSSPKTVAADLEVKGQVDPLVTKALAEQTLQDGGVFVPPEFAAEFIQLLRAQTVCRESGMRVVPMSGQQLVYALQNSAGTAYYEGENVAVLASQQKFGQLRLNVKKLMALTAVSNDLLRDAGPAADMVVRDDLAAIMSLKMDLAFIRGDGLQESPKGLLNIINSNNVFNATQGGSDATFAEIAGDAAKAVRLIKEANVPFKIADLGWLMPPRAEGYLASVSSTYGVFPFKDEVLQGKFWNINFKTTTQIPTNLGGGTDESEVYLVAWPHYIMGENTSLSIEVFPGGSYADASGTIQSGISSDQTPIRAIMRHDCALRYDKAAVLINQNKWGA